MTCPGQCPKGPSDHSWVPIWKVENIPSRLLLICKRQLSVHLFATLVHGLQQGALVCHIYFHLFACWVFFEYFWLFKCNLPWSFVILQLQMNCYFQNTYEIYCLSMTMLLESFCQKIDVY